MTSVRTLAQWIHLGVVVLTTVGALIFLVRTRFWFPKYVHVMAAVAFAIGLGLLQIGAFADPDAPVNRGKWAPVKQALLLLFFPAVVYAAFVHYGGQRAAYEDRARRAVTCPHCGQASGVPGSACSGCGQTILVRR
jgi:hypothetical protein